MLLTHEGNFGTDTYNSMMSATALFYVLYNLLDLQDIEHASCQNLRNVPTIADDSPPGCKFAAPVKSSGDTERKNEGVTIIRINSQRIVPVTRSHLPVPVKKYCQFCYSASLYL
jgi:hypothetical protein